jgi:hypothetical protein
MPTLTYCDVDGVERTAELGAAGVVAGRNPDCNIRSEDGRVSRRHARFFLDGGWVWVEDLGSANGVWVGATRVGARAPVPIGELVVAGSLILRALDPQVPPQISPGVHAQLAEWLVSERRLHQGVVAERDAFAKRVGEVHEELERAKGRASGLEAAERRVAELEKRVAESERKARDAEARAAQAEHKAAAPAAPAAADPAPAARIADLEGELERLRRRLTETDAELDEFDRLKESSARMKAALAEAEARLAARPAAAASALPAGFAEQVATLSDSISSLRASMRAISDETAVMEPNDSLTVVTSAVTTATEEIERARDALRTLSALSTA